ncbi:hypothetical protein V202x_17610 [Gimesia aquarii]|uniref:Cytochrome C n=2 Tax=Gimesia aquarii TaxID=2527964 RepID=A0A517WT09_9PLAN|nr:hypothetical protein V202x_17610 [Gimesia aquarii]
MKLQRHSRLILVMLGCTLFGAAMVLLFQLIWQAAEEHERNPNRVNLRNQIMRRKTKTMHDILDGMIYGDLGRVETAANRMQKYSETINEFLLDPRYEKLSLEFDLSISELSDSAIRKDMDAAKEATLRLERNCIECHSHINRKNRNLKPKATNESSFNET